MSALLALLVERHGLRTEASSGPAVETFLEVHSPAGWTMTATPRPAYCDRGRWIVQAWGPPGVDAADGFPRYYFGSDACASEIAAYIEARS